MKKVALDRHTAVRVAEMFGAFGDPTHVRIISMLVNNEQSVGTLATAIGLSVSAVSHHLHELRQLRLVWTRRDGRQVFYCLDEHVAHLFRYGLDHVRRDADPGPETYK